MRIPEDIEKFPVLQVLHDLVDSLRINPVTLLEAPPGAGKSTVLPLHFLDQDFLHDKKIIIIEPRRLAAKSVAARLSEQLAEPIGKSVGYKIRFEGKFSSESKILVVTEGVFINLLQRDPGLTDTTLVILDEFHERNIQSDLSLLMLRQTQQLFRPDLKILIMSATLDSIRLSLLLKAPVISSSGKQYPVSFQYVPSSGVNGLAEQTVAVLNRVLRETGGDVLVFLPGTGEIKRTAALLEQCDFPVLVVTLYGDMPFSKQQQVLTPDSVGRRKVILSTAIAETSLTIEGISVVVDSGYAREPRFDPRSGLTRLLTVPVTLDRATQRAGRAGRLGPGVCYRMWAQNKTATLVPSKKPEIVDADLSPVMLELFKWGISDPFEIDWVDQPPRGHISQALEVLQNLNFLDRNKITNLGKRAAEYATHPRLAAMILTAGENLKLRLLCCDLIALLEERDPLSDRLNADVVIRLKLMKDFRDGFKVSADRSALERLVRLADSWRGILKVEDRVTDYFDSVEGDSGILLASAYPDRLARQLEKLSSRYKISNGKILTLDKHDPLIHSPFIVIAEADSGSSAGKIFLAAAVNPFSIPGLLHENKILKWSEAQEQFIAYHVIQAGTLILEERQVALEYNAALTDQLINKIGEIGLHWAGVDDSFQQLICRLRSFSIWNSDDSFPDFSEASILSTMNDWLRPFLNGINGRAGLEKLDWEMILLTRLTYDQRSRFERLIPEKLTVPSGSSIRLLYFEDGRSPELHVRLQEVFGLLDTPRINDGRIPVTLNLLSPAYRPVQVTSDLKNFWANTYFEVRKELRSRYPKHSWPDNPLDAVAVRGVKRKA
jgi:ATP-dependent helicase HrpB